MALGWTLVNYWTASPGRVRVHQVRMIVSLAAGALVVALLGLTMPQAALTGVFVFALSALVAYAGNAKQVSRLPDPPNLSAPGNPATPDERVAVLLVNEGEPTAYDGPLTWARRFRVLESADVSIPHWFVRPLTYARIRSAYRSMDAAHTLDGTISTLAKELERALGSAYLVQCAGLFTSPTLSVSLNRLAKGGIRRIIILPLGMDEAAPEVIREQVSASRVREAGVAVSYAAPLSHWPWPATSYAERMRQLSQGLPPPRPERLGSDTLQAARQYIAAAETT